MGTGERERMQEKMRERERRKEGNIETARERDRQTELSGGDVPVTVLHYPLCDSIGC